MACTPLFGLIWALAVAGIVGQAVGGVRHPRLSTGLYVAMGWLILAAAQPLWHTMPEWGLCWLAAGGFAYTAGVGFYAASYFPVQKSVLDAGQPVSNGETVR